MSSDTEIDRKRKSSHEFQIPRKFPSQDHIVDEEDNDLLTLSLSFRPSAATRPRILSSVQPPPPTTTTTTQLNLPPPQSQPPTSPLLMQIQPSFLHPAPPPPPPPMYPLCMLPMPMPRPVLDAPSQPLMQPPAAAGPTMPTRPTRQRRNLSQEQREGKAGSSEMVPPPFPWATTQRATVHSLNYLVSKEILKIRGEVQCKRCDRQYEMEFDLREKFVEVGRFIAENKSGMHERAPAVWMNPVLPSCKICEQENCLKPIIPEDKDAINWLFLLLGQMLGCCTLEQLKYFCKHTKNHRTGAKDRVLFLTYLGLCKQLDPNGPFDR